MTVWPTIVPSSASAAWQWPSSPSRTRLDDGVAHIAGGEQRNLATGNARVLPVASFGVMPGIWYDREAPGWRSQADVVVGVCRAAARCD
jgi:hypothetical protein